MSNKKAKESLLGALQHIASQPFITMKVDKKCCVLT